MRVIPAIDIMGGEVVRLYKGDPAKKTVYSADPIGMARQWEAGGADMLHIVDLDATLGLGSNHGMITDVAAAVSLPVQVAGGLRDMGAVSAMAGVAQRMVIGTLAFGDKDALAGLLSRFGADRIIVSVDHRAGSIVTHGWQRDAGVGLLGAIQEFVGMGVREFLLTDVGRDGTLEGPELDYLERACAMPGTRIIASGGISKPQDISDVRSRGASGVILGKALYDGRVTIREARELC